MFSPQSARYLIAIGSVALLALAGCSTTPGSSSESSPSPENSIVAAAPLPESIQKAGEITIATDGSLPPNNFVGPDGVTLQGVSVDMGNALAKVLGVKANFVNTKFASIITGIQAGKYDVAISGMADTEEREKQVDFVDFIASGEIFLVPKGNPANVTSLDTVCGKRASLIAGTISVDITKQASEACVKNGKNPVTISVFPDAPTVVLQLQNSRSDFNITAAGKAAYQAQQLHGEVEVAGTMFNNQYNGVAIRKESPELVKAVQWAFDQIMKSGEYAAILKKWDVEEAQIDQLAFNGAAAFAQEQG